MRSRNLVSSITLGAVFTIGLLFALNLCPAPAQAQPALAPAAPTIDHSDIISEAVAYLQMKQLPNGGIEGWTPGAADDFTTIKTVIALVAARYPVSFLTSVSDTTTLDYLKTQAFSYTRDLSGTLFPGRIGMLIAAAVAGDGIPYGFGEYPTGHGSAGLPINLVEGLQTTYNPATGAYSTTASQGWTSGAAGTTNQLWAIIGLAAAQETVPVSATYFLVSLQETDGGWGWGFGGDVDTTALVLQALIASGNVEPNHAKVQAGLDFLRNAQTDSGGWEAWDSLSADSTAAAIQSIAAVGYTPATEGWAASGGRTPHDDLVGLQAADGSFSDNSLSTAHAIAGLAEAPLPVLGQQQRANRALTWMNEQQNADGSWSTFGFPDAGATCDAVLAYAAASFDPDSVIAAGSLTSAMDYLSSAAPSYVNTSSDAAGKLAVAVEAAGGDAHDFGGVDIVDVLNNTWYSPTLSAFGVPTNTWHQAFAILGLAAAGETIPVSATQTLVGLQQSDGGWKYDFGPWSFASDADSTGLAMQALIAAGVLPSDISVVSATGFLANQQDAWGGWSNANSTAYAMQGLLAAGENLVADWASEYGHSPYDALAAYQKSDGPFVWMWDSPWGPPNDDFFATRQAVPALMGQYYPLPSATLTPFGGVNRGPDPDRMVACQPRAAWGNSVGVVIPFGSDLDGDGSVALDWRAHGQTSWVTGTEVHRGDGYYTATLPGTALLVYEIRATFTDPDGVQYGPTMSVTLEPQHIYLPLIMRYH
ncbi:MAG: prenyltransferase/squalene oxidase repeat-containing protein [Chloroflexota bacterium]|nr:prenyltransferase/squalene oxidase repeat-containing protein [Chloroflexota bacterium]